MSKRVLVDQDGVVAHFELHSLEVWRAKYPEEFFVAVEDRVGWSCEEQYPAHARERLWQMWRTPGFFRSMPPYPGAVQALYEMRAAGHHVVLCTAPMKGHDTCAAEKVAWVREHLGDEFADMMVITRDKTLVHGDVLIDDRHEITGSVEKPSWEHLLFEVPHNRHVTNRRKVHWGNWRQVIEP